MCAKVLRSQVLLLISREGAKKSFTFLFKRKLNLYNKVILKRTNSTEALKPVLTLESKSGKSWDARGKKKKKGEVMMIFFHKFNPNMKRKRIEDSEAEHLHKHTPLLIR